MAGLLRIDGKTFRFMGLPGSTIPAMRQESVRIFPTRTEFEFSEGDVRLGLEFLSPLDPRDLKLLSLPLVFLRAEVRAEKPRDIQLYLEITGEWAVGASERRITWDGAFRIRPSQPRLFRETHNSPDWGEVRWEAIDGPATPRYGPDRDVRRAFVEGGSPPRDVRYPRAANDDWPVFAHSWNLGRVERAVVRRALLAHVRRDAVTFLGDSCSAAWTRHFDDGAALVAWASGAADRIRERCRAVDAEVLSRARAAGGEPLAALAALAFRPVFAAREAVVCRKKSMSFAKSMEIGAGSLIQALDALAPAAPALLAFNPSLLRAELEPVLETLRRGAWHERFAPPDLGTYPNATGAASGAGTWIGATADLLLLSAALAPHDPAFWEEARPLLRPFGEFLIEADPRGDLALALKTITAVATLPDLRPEAEKLLKNWLAQAEAGDHTAGIAGDPASWSLKPDFFIDRLLGLDLVPRAVVERDLAFWRARAARFGVPADSRRPVARLDALLQVAALVPREEREAWLAPLLRALSETSSRTPPADRYETETARPAGSPARPTLGAVFAPVLLHERGPGR